MKSIKLNYSILPLMMCIVVLFSSCQEEAIAENQVENPFDLPLNKYVEYMVEKGESDITSKVAEYMAVNHFTFNESPKVNDSPQARQENILQGPLRPPISNSCSYVYSTGRDDTNSYRIWELSGPNCVFRGCTHIWTYGEGGGLSPIKQDFYCF